MPPHSMCLKEGCSWAGDDPNPSALYDEMAEHALSHVRNIGFTRFIVEPNPGEITTRELADVITIGSYSIALTLPLPE